MGTSSSKTTDSSSDFEDHVYNDTTENRDIFWD